METGLILGYIAMSTNIIVMVLQAIKSFKTKSVRDISTLSQVVGLATSIMWLCYAVSIFAMPNLILSGISIAYVIGILVYKYKTKCLFEF